MTREKGPNAPYSNRPMSRFQYLMLKAIEGGARLDRAYLIALEVSPDRWFEEAPRTYQEWSELDAARLAAAMATNTPGRRRRTLSRTRGR